MLHRTRHHDSIGDTNVQEEESPSGPSESLSSTESDNSRSSARPAKHSAKSSRRRRDWSPDQTSARNRKADGVDRETRLHREHGVSDRIFSTSKDADDVHGTEFRNEGRGKRSERETQRLKHSGVSPRRKGNTRAHRSGGRLDNRHQSRGEFDTESHQYSVDEIERRGGRRDRSARENGRSRSLNRQRERDSGDAPSDSDVNEQRGSGDGFGSGESDQPCSRENWKHYRRRRSGGRRRRHRTNSNDSHPDPDLATLPARKQASEQRRRHGSPEDTDSHVEGTSDVDDNSSGDRQLRPRASSHIARASGRLNEREPSPRMTSPCSSSAKEGQTTQHNAQDSSAQPLQRTSGTPPGGVSMGKPIRGARTGEAIGMRSRVFDTTTIPTGTADLKNFVCSPLRCGPGSVARCFIERNRSGTHTLSHVFSMYADLEDGSGRLLLAARKVNNP